MANYCFDIYKHSDPIMTLAFYKTSFPPFIIIIVLLQIWIGWSIRIYESPCDTNSYDS